MSANKQQDSHKPPSDGSVAKEEFIRVGTSLYKIVEQPRLNGGYVKHGTTKPCAKTTARTTSAAFPSMTVSAPYPNTSATALWSVSSLTSMNR
jgi:hypothetical protein